VPVLRRAPQASPATFKVPAGTTVCVIALLLVAWLLSNSTASQARDTAIAIAIGSLIYAASRVAASKAKGQRGNPNKRNDQKQQAR
jgi:hypothetical protein